MPYVVRKGQLHYEPNTGNGPCNRRLVGTENRRVIAGVHVTKGRVHHDGAGGVQLVHVAPGPAAAKPNGERIARNDARKWAAASGRRAGPVTRQQRRAAARAAAKTEGR